MYSFPKQSQQKVSVETVGWSTFWVYSLHQEWECKGEIASIQRWGVRVRNEVWAGTFSLPDPLNSPSSFFFAPHSNIHSLFCIRQKMYNNLTWAVKETNSKHKTNKDTSRTWANIYPPINRLSGNYPRVVCGNWLHPYLCSSWFYTSL